MYKERIEIGYEHKRIVRMSIRRQCITLEELSSVVVIPEPRERSGVHM